MGLYKPTYAPQVILVRIETSPDDIHGLHAAEGVLTPGYCFQGMYQKCSVQAEMKEVFARLQFPKLLSTFHGSLPESLHGRPKFE